MSTVSEATAMKVETDYLIMGSGIAGLSFALQVAGSGT